MINKILKNNRFSRASKENFVYVKISLKIQKKEYEKNLLLPKEGCVVIFLDINVFYEQNKFYNPIFWANTKQLNNCKSSAKREIK